MLTQTRRRPRLTCQVSDHRAERLNDDDDDDDDHLTRHLTRHLGAWW